ncbi:MAG: hypothetical protein LWX11_11095, partial [Firmicutes bacterium]|nr:hypothetical protein [Bacillota bacterium]
KLEVLRLVTGPEGPQVAPEEVDIVQDEPLKLELEAFYAACLGQSGDTVSWSDAFEAMRVAEQVQNAVAESLKQLA